MNLCLYHRSKNEGVIKMEQVTLFSKKVRLKLE